LVPVRNGARPEAPEGSHSTQAGTAPELAGALAPDDPPEPDRPDPDWPDPDWPVPDWPEDVSAGDPLDRAEVAPEEPTEEAPPVEVPDREAAVEDAVPVADEFTAPRGFARLVPPPAVGAAAVCAAAGSASTTESSNARCSSLCIRSRSLKRFLPIARLC
jgi:hypothetical protein